MHRDLVVLVPDKNIEQTIAALLDRHRSIGIRPLSQTSFIVHPGRDPGVYNTGHALLAHFVNEAEHALIVFDRAWEGAPTADPTSLAEHVEQLCRNDWGERVRCICIDPEIESWVWSDSPHVATTLRWKDLKELRAWLQKDGLWPNGVAKPPDPKKAFEKATQHKGVVRSSSIFGELARKVSFRRCQDPSFLALIAILQSWFPVPQTVQD